MANSLMNILGNFTGGGSGNIMMQAVGAFMRGESPMEFMRGLARTRPELQGMDFSDINAAAQKVCREHNVDPQKLTKEVTQYIQNMK